MPRRPDKVESWVRFVCGALFVALCLWRFVRSARGSGRGSIELAVERRWRYRPDDHRRERRSRRLVRGAYGDRFWYGVFQVYNHRIFKNASAKKSADRQKSARPFAAMKYFNGKSARCDTTMPPKIQRCVAAPVI